MSRFHGDNYEPVSWWAALGPILGVLGAIGLLLSAITVGAWLVNLLTWLAQ